MRNITHIVVHCTATAQTATVSSIQRYWRTTLGWKSPGYHIVVTPGGAAIRLAEDHQRTNGVRGHNASSLHISYIGGVDANNKLMDNRTPEQKATLLLMIKDWLQRYPDAVVCGHRDFSPDRNGNGVIDVPEFIKMCPAFDALAEYNHLAC